MHVEQVNTNQFADSMVKITVRALGMMTVLTLVLGIAYPLVVTGVAQGLFPHQANGSILSVDGQAVGSKLIGQDFSGTSFFQSRPSLTAKTPYNAQASGASNWSPSNLKQQDVMHERALQWQRAVAQEKVPVDLLTASGSGLDPHITVQAAYYQVPIVSERTGLSPAVLRSLIDENTEHALFGSHSYVNVLSLNLAIKAAQDRYDP